jgi:hypothetical protein
MNAYSHLINPNYRYNYALIVRTLGEVYTTCSNEQAAPLRQLFKRLDGLRREWRCNYHLHAELVNLNTGKIIMVVFD